MYKQFFLVATVLLTCVSPLVAQTLSLPSASDQVIRQGVSFLPDSTGNLSVESAAAGKYRPVDSLSWNKNVPVYWLKLVVKNETGLDNEWLFDFENWSFVDFYTATNGSFEVKSTGHLRPFKKRDYPVSNKNYIRLVVQNDSTQTCFVRLESSFNNEKIPQNLFFKVSPRSLLDKQNSMVGRTIYAFLGIFIVMFLYNFFVFLATRLKSYAWYLLVLFFAFYHTAYNSGYLVSLFSGVEQLPVLLLWFERISSPLFGISVVLFVQEFLQTKNRYPRWHVTLNVFMAINSGLVLLNFIAPDWGLAISGLVGVLFIPLVLTLAVINVIRKYPSALYFLLGYSAFFIGILTTILTLLGLLPANNFNYYYALPLGTTLEIVLFSFALANLINVLRKENEAKQARIIVQLRENQDLQTKVTRELEQKVEERTFEINAQKEQIFRQKEAIELEKEKSDQLLLNILPESTAQELKEKGFATPKQYQNVTVLFTDFVAFTQIAERLSPDELVTELDYCFRAFDDIITNNGLEKIKTIGDAYMAAAGVPEKDENGAYNTVKAAIEIVRFMESWTKLKIEQKEAPWQLRIGIHTGAITAGVVGKKKFAFDIWGDTVNVASILETRGIPGKINISETTYELVKNKFICTYRGKIEAKHQKQMDMYLLDADQA
jgi:class 3 adenylate cyclase